MTVITKFLDFVEIRTKLATFIPFLTALAFVFYQTGTINFIATLIYIPAALLLDMSVTAVNNHFNMREEGKEPHYSKWVSFGIIALMLLTSACIGVFLIYSFGNLTLLLVGIFCFFVGIGYTFGPMPISKTLYGEVVSSFLVTTVIMYIVVSINNPDFMPIEVRALGFGRAIDSLGEIVVINSANYRLLEDIWVFFHIDVVSLISFGLFTLPAMSSAANILLANNICDEEQDRQFRFTLVHNIGKPRALKVYAMLYYLAYFFVVVAVLLRIVPVWSLLSLLTFFIVRKNIKIFTDKQTKSETFVLAVKNFVMITLTYAIGIFIGGVLY